MAAVPLPTFLVDAYSDPVVVRVNGRANFQNSPGLRDFFQEMLRQGKRRYVIDFHGCAGMDSTFLGVLAGHALQLRKLNPPGALTLCRLGSRNLELIRNLGLHRLTIVDCDRRDLVFEGKGFPISGRELDELEAARLCLEAHNSLVEADESNRARFQDVLAFLKNRVDQG